MPNVLVCLPDALTEALDVHVIKNRTNRTTPPQDICLEAKRLASAHGIVVANDFLKKFTRTLPGTSRTAFVAQMVALGLETYITNGNSLTPPTTKTPPPKRPHQNAPTSPHPIAPHGHQKAHQNLRIKCA